MTEWLIRIQLRVFFFAVAVIGRFAASLIRQTNKLLDRYAPLEPKTRACLWCGEIALHRRSRSGLYIISIATTHDASCGVRCINGAGPGRALTAAEFESFHQGPDCTHCRNLQARHTA